MKINKIILRMNEDSPFQISRLDIRVWIFQRMDCEKCYPLSWAWNVLLPIIPVLLEIFKTTFRSSLLSLHYNALWNPGAMNMEKNPALTYFSLVSTFPHGQRIWWWASDFFWHFWNVLDNDRGIEKLEMGKYS